jgi:hypothetical protein
VDSQDSLYGFFGERINDLNHGMWQTLWTGNFWTQPEPVVKGPQIRDGIGGNGFDPRAARAVVSNGNTVLVTWTTDGFAGENGVWFSYKRFNVPELPAIPLPGSQVVNQVNLTPTVSTTEQPLAESTASSLADFGLETDPPKEAYSPQRTIFMGVLPVMLFIAGMVLLRYFQSRKL